MSQSNTIIEKEDMPKINVAKTDGVVKNSADITKKHVVSKEKDVMPQLDSATFTSQLFWLVISFTILYFIIAKICISSIMEVRINRKEKIDRDLDRADRFKEESVQIKEEYESFIHDSYSKAGDIIEEASNSSKEKSDKRFEELEKSASRKIAEAEKNIEELRAKAIKEISAFSADLSVQIVEKIAGVKITKNKALETIEKINK